MAEIVRLYVDGETHDLSLLMWEQAVREKRSDFTKRWEIPNVSTVVSELRERLLERSLATACPRPTVSAKE
ncbi:hypothetical protein GCM10007079_17150 [Nocardiopsis terrae]|uniref:Uncharacterized protein n=1 Tax=Nocardiopsis terrae TaxID=372655 RepID=A0ABR9HI01_9ACTN|nr:hypothetical protein [Nocardiopsis terrae]MBE1458659.1 hypothetical protein [Nocardiopsis terrae]GHC79200.1 hypothetical protein GCM10007079_17150 [Nocardiopsis terrae]